MFKLFGTDGIRGKANQWPITPEVMMRVGRAAAYYFKQAITKRENSALTSFFPYEKHIHDPHKLTVVIGKDTRLSGYMIENALTSGLTAQGANVIMLGPLPTPAIAMLVRSLRADVGIMISASHNPYFDNGIKFFDSNGIKLDHNVEQSIENIIENEDLQLPEDCGGAIRLNDAAGRYVEFVKATFPKGYNLEGIKIALDCANGAAYKVAPYVFWELGATVSTIGDNPNGHNINKDCGVLYPNALFESMKENQADIGIALDGDADRILIVTPSLEIINGDQILALIAKNWQEKGILCGGVVSTCMSNIGLSEYLNSIGISHVESAVGDKNVVEKMRNTQSNLGGEESGHIILSDYTTTGDGIIAALQVLGILVEKNKKIDDIFPIFKETPKRIKNFKIDSEKNEITDNMIDEIKAMNQSVFGNKGKIIVRRSGTEPVLRIMVQHININIIDQTFEKIEDIIFGTV
ncbi:MAG: phosphoglucosamine mutase [Holosporales bacterium]|jgi:phosphoglucosamine mutase|nr:phosphoglucosamine mutase [Holosporales bacterium]